MTTDQMKEASDGSRMWQEYVRLNGYAFEPNDAGLKKLARILDLAVPYIRHRIHLYLSA